MSLTRAMPAVALLLSIWVCIGAAKEETVGECQVSADTVSFVQVRQQINRGSQNAQRLSQIPWNEVPKVPGYPYIPEPPTVVDAYFNDNMPTEQALQIVNQEQVAGVVGDNGTKQQEILAQHVLGDYAATVKTRQENLITGPVNAPVPPQAGLNPFSFNLSYRRPADMWTVQSAPEIKTSLDPLSSTSLTDDQTKARQEATRDCVLSDWQPWSSCDKLERDIESATQATRNKVIIQPPVPGGKGCGLMTEAKECIGVD